MKKGFILLGCIFLAVCSFAQKAPSHQQWDKLLKKYVNNSGMVNYKGLQKDQADLDAYLKTLSDNAPQDNWSEDEKKAFWINAYNAFTVALILKHYPVKSIKDIAGNIYKINTPWDIKFITIGAKKYDLNNIEHGILRKNLTIHAFTLPSFVLLYLVRDCEMKPILLPGLTPCLKMQEEVF
jgi:hypothetical protein